eukprot:367986-Pyramimonas_sp.AAC.1
MDVGTTTGVTEPLMVTLFPPGMSREPNVYLPESIAIPQVDEIIVLGTMIARNFKDHDDVRYRMGKA